MTPLTGSFLVARPVLRDPNFRQSVVLVLEHGDGGALGVIVNRPVPAKELPMPVFMGGPCQSPGLIMLHGHADWGNASSGRELSPLDCGTLKEAPPLPYGDDPRTFNVSAVTGYAPLRAGDDAGFLVPDIAAEAAQQGEEPRGGGVGDQPRPTPPGQGVVREGDDGVGHQNQKRRDCRETSLQRALVGLHRSTERSQITDVAEHDRHRCARHHRPPKNISGKNRLPRIAPAMSISSSPILITGVNITASL